MQVSGVCKNYFSGFQEVCNCRKNNNAVKALALLKILSYCTLVIPLTFLVIYGTASLCGRVSQRQGLLPLDQNVNKIAKAKMTQPEIVSDEWRAISLRVNGVIQKFRDVVILPSNDTEIALEWDWKWDQEEMQHRPGIRIKDIDHFIFSHVPKPDVIILSRGRGLGGQLDNAGPGMLEVDSSIRDYIVTQGVNEIYILKTAAAIKKYEEIRSQGNKRIAALIHTTC